MKKLIVCIGVSFFLMTSLGGCGSTSYFERRDATQVEAKSTEQTEENGDAAASDEEPDGAVTEEEPTEVYVQVSGAVEQPGVFAVAPGTRVFQVIQMAGGLCGDAADAAINQAQAVFDGQQIYVYTVEEAERLTQEDGGAVGVAREGGSAAGGDGRLNINTATREELLTLSGIGASKADAILEYRQKNGAFARIEDLMLIPGIKEGVFSKISEDICVN